MFIVFFISRYLTGNPCSQYEGYRDYCIATLTHLQVESLIFTQNKSSQTLSKGPS